jgi:DNA-binding CsgD family transcriptional regulator/tetratricopeptide (TPR) repeat protein
VIASAPLQSDFVGRTSELSYLAERFENTRAGCGSLVLISGDTGIGKSRLLREFTEGLLPHSYHVREARCLEYLQTPLAVASELMGAGDVDGGRSNRVAAAQEKRATFEAAMRYLRTLAADLPVVVTIEDLQWADDASLEFVDYLGRSAAHFRLLIVVTLRTGVLEAPSLQLRLSQMLRDGAHEIMMRPLTAGEMQHLVRQSSARGVLASPVLRQIERSAEGNPLFLEELLRDAIREVMSQRTSLPVVPRTMEAIANKRLALLDEYDSQILARAAIIGREFTPALLGATIGLMERDVVEVLQRAVRAGLIAEVGREPAAFAFPHSYTREAIYRQLTPSMARYVHAEVATALENRAMPVLAELAYHWAAAGVPAQAVGYNEAAGNEAVALHGYSDAIRFYRTALDFEVDLTARRAALSESIARACRAAGILDDAIGWYREAIRIHRALGNDQQALQNSITLLFVAWANADGEQGVAAAQEALEVARSAGSAELRFRGLIAVADNYGYYGTPAGAVELLREAGEAYVPSGELVARWHDAHGKVYRALGQWDRALEHFARGGSAAEEVGEPELIVRMMTNQAECAASIGLFALAQTIWERVMLVTRERLRGWRQQYAILGCATLYYSQGRLLDAASLVAEVLIDRVESPVVRMQLASVGIPVGLRLNDTTLLKRCFDLEVIDLAVRSRDGAHVGRVVSAFAQWFAYYGKMHEARALLTRALNAVSNADQCEPMFVDFAAYGPIQEVKLARERLETVAKSDNRHISNAFLQLFDAIVASRTRHRTAKGTGARAAEGFGRLGLRPYEAWSHELAGNFEAARCGYASMGDVWHEAAVARRRPVKVAEDGCLTSRERQVSDLVVRGYANRAIAVELGISEKTVDHHMQSIFRRLNVNSRSQLIARRLHTT